ncbi:tRNA-dihydrouridine synthase 1 [Ceratobasidium sp. AG-Ba]|nr:tRNA-dihydrouridine synthase 1 [Ceratobasidium sp. AG-Ba]
MENDDIASPEIIPPDKMLDLFGKLNIAAPMVRYSKLPFRHLVSLYDVHITHTPMMMAAEFSRSATARHSDFTTSKQERGIFVLPEKDGGRKRRVRGSLVAQFAANDPKAFADACELIQPHVDGVDLNCGCPQPWAYSEHVGSWLLRQPDRVRDLVRAAKDRLGWSYPVSIKVRVDADLQRTQQLMETAAHAGASYITVHGRTRHQVSTLPVSLPAISFARECAKGAVPVVANGDAWGVTENELIRRETGCQAVMSARGLLANPALFSGYEVTPIWPGAWHGRLFAPILRQWFNKILYTPKKRHIFWTKVSPIGRTLLPSATGKDKGIQIVSKSWAAPDDCDWNGHLSNSCYAKNLDPLRMLVRTEWLPALFEDGGWIALAGEHYHFIREIPVGANYEIRVSVGGWEKKWIYLVAKFVTYPPHSVHPPNANTIPTSRQLKTHDEDGALIHCVAVSTICAKHGRVTIPPQIAFAMSGISLSEPGSEKNWKRATEIRARGRGEVQKFLRGGWKNEEHWWEASAEVEHERKRRVELLELLGRGMDGLRM